MGLQDAPSVVMVAPSVLHLQQALVLRCIPRYPELQGVGNEQRIQQLVKLLLDALHAQRGAHRAAAEASRSAATAAKGEGYAVAA